MSWRRLEDMSWRRLQGMSSSRLEDVFSVTIFRLPRRLAGGLENVFKTSAWRLGRRKTVTQKTCWRHLRDMSWRRLQDVLKTNKSLLGCSQLLIHYPRSYSREATAAPVLLCGLNPLKTNVPLI